MSPLSLVLPRTRTVGRVTTPAGRVGDAKSSLVGVQLLNLPEGASVSSGYPEPSAVETREGIVVVPAEQLSWVAVESGDSRREMQVLLSGAPPRPVDYFAMPISMLDGVAQAPQGPAVVYLVGIDPKREVVAIDGERFPLDVLPGQPFPRFLVQPGRHLFEIAWDDGTTHRVEVEPGAGDVIDITNRDFEGPADDGGGTVLPTIPPSTTAAPVPTTPSTTTPPPGVTRPGTTPPGLTESRGTARVSVEPPTARVLIGGVEVQGPAHERSVPPGRYLAEVSAPGFLPRVVELNVLDGRVAEARVQLARARSPKGARVALGVFAAAALVVIAAAAAGVMADRRRSAEGDESPDRW